MPGVQERQPPIRDRQPAAGQRAASLSPSVDSNSAQYGHCGSQKISSCTGAIHEPDQHAVAVQGSRHVGVRGAGGEHHQSQRRCQYAQVGPHCRVPFASEFVSRMPVGNHIDRRRCHRDGVRVAIVAESFLPHVNGVSNSVVRTLEHLRRTGHEALVIAPDTPHGDEPPPIGSTTASGCTGCRRWMFPKVTTLPLGLPLPRILRVLRGFEPDVVHLASPALLGWGGVKAARRLGVPTVAVYQTDVPGFAASYGIGITARAAWAWFRHLHRLADRTLAPSTATMESLVAHGIPRVHKWARGVDMIGYAPSARDEALRQHWSPDGKPIVGFVGRLAPEKHVERLHLAGRRRRRAGGHRRRRGRPRQAAIGNADSRFHRCAVRRGARRRRTPAWTSSSTPASTRRSARSCRRRWRPGCR